LHRALVRDRLGLRDQDDLIDPGFLVELNSFDAAVRVAGDDDAAVAQGVRIHLAEGRARRARTAVERDPDLRGLFLVCGVGLPEPSAEIGLQVIGHTAPRLQQLLVGVDAIADVRLVRAEERLERERGERARLGVVLAAEAVDVVAPVVVDHGAHGRRLLDPRPITLDVLGQDVRGEGGRRQDADTLVGRHVVALGLRARQVHGRVRLLVGLRQHVALGHLPESSLPGELFRLPDARDHRDGLFPHRARVARVDALTDLLVGVGSPGAELEAAVGQLVQHGGALGGADRMV